VNLKKMQFVLLGLLLFIVSLGVSTSALANSSMTIASREKTLRVVNGQMVTFEIDISNTGDTALTDVSVQIDLPYKWLMQSAIPERLTLQPGERGTIEIRLAVPVSENASTHTLKVLCVSGDTTSNDLSIPVAVVTNPVYLYIILAAIICMLAITLIFFKKNVRR